MRESGSKALSVGRLLILMAIVWAGVLLALISPCRAFAFEDPEYVSDGDLTGDRYDCEIRYDLWTEADDERVKSLGFWYEYVERPNGEIAVRVSYSWGIDRSSVKHIEIPAYINGCPVRFIGSGAFHGAGDQGEYTGLQSITIPDTVICLEYDAFHDCTSLRTVQVGSGVEYVGEYAFARCTSLTSLSFPEATRYVRPSAFEGCTSLTEVSFAGNLDWVGRDDGYYSYGFYEGAFKDCGALESVIISGDVGCLGYRCFEGCTSLRSFSAKSVKYVRDAAFAGCSNLVSLDVPDGLGDLSGGAFNACSQLSSPITFMDGTTRIDSAFVGCSSLVDVTLPTTLTSMSRAFSDCVSLESIEVPGSVKDLDGAFSGCERLKDVTLNEGIERLGDAFENCSSLERIALPASLVNLGYGTFDGCVSLKEMTIPDGITYIPECVFANCVSLEKLVVPDGCTFFMSPASFGIGSYEGCFKNCPKLTVHCSVHNEFYDQAIKEGLRVVATDADNGVPNEGAVPWVVVDSGTAGSLTWQVKSATFDVSRVSRYHDKGIDEITETELVISGEGAIPDYYGDYPLSSSSLIPKAYAEDSDEGHGQPWAAYLADLDKLTIGEGVTEIGAYAFEGLDDVNPGFWNRMANVTLPDSVETIGYGAFGSCSALKWVSVGDGVRYISDDAFRSFDGVLYCSLDSTAHKFAKKRGISYRLRETDTRTREITVPFFVGQADVGSQDVNLSFDWGWRLLAKEPSLYDNRLAVAGLALSGATEHSKARAESLLRADGESGFGCTTVDSKNYGGENRFQHPAVTFGYKRIVLDSRECNVFIVAVRGTELTEHDLETDFAAVADYFRPAAANTRADLENFMQMATNGKSLEEIAGERNIFFLTGHSLGGAVVNHMALDLSAYTENSGKVFAYTYATPKTTSDPVAASIFNIVCQEDVVSMIPPTVSLRNGTDISWTSSWVNNDRFMFYFAALTGKQWVRQSSNLVMGVLSATLNKHLVETYMAYLISRSGASFSSSYVKGDRIRIASVMCPVDVEVLDGNGSLLGRIVDNQIDPNVDSQVLMCVDGDAKYVYLPSDVNCSLRLIGSGSGTMTYSISDVAPASGAVIDSKTFSDVELTVGKRFSSDLSSATDETRLLVVDERGDAISEVAEDGVETPAVSDGGDSSSSGSGSAANIPADTPGRIEHEEHSSDGSGSGPSAPAESDLASYAGKAKAAGFIDLDANAWYMSEGFKDGSGNVVATYLDYAVGRGLMSGYSGTTRFAPDDGVSRAMVATIIYRLATGKTAETTDNDVPTKFSDVPSGRWYSAAVAWCAERGIVKGYESGPNAGRFCPDGPVTREELATMVGRYCVNVEGMAPAGEDVSRFRDAAGISAFARAGVAFCAANGIVSGIGGTGDFQPQGKASRCQMAKIIAVTARLVE